MSAVKAETRPGTSLTHVELGPGAVSPAGVARHLVGVCPILDPKLDLAGRVKDARARETAILSVWLRGGVEVCRSVGKDGRIPRGEVRVVGNERVEGVPLELGRNQARVGTNAARRWRLVVGRPGVVGPARLGRSSVERRIGLHHVNQKNVSSPFIQVGRELKDRAPTEVG